MCVLAPDSYQLVSIGMVVTAGALVEYHSGWNACFKMAL